jgi:hypothetical protein
MASDYSIRDAINSDIETIVAFTLQEARESEGAKRIRRREAWRPRRVRKSRCAHSRTVGGVQAVEVLNSPKSDS